MRKKIAAGNWKMNLNAKEAFNLFQAITDACKKMKLKEHQAVILAPPAIYLQNMQQQLKDNNIQLAAQNCHQETSGAYTGCISAQMIAALGVDFVITGHSERRAYFGETDADIRDKVKSILTAGLSPIYCCGESLEIRKSGNYIDFILNQIKESLGTLNPSQMSNLIIAYEPVWAIGTGETASPEQAQEVHAAIRNWIAAHFSTSTAEETTLLYGGSCNEKNAASLFAQKDVDGGLIGGASLKAESFISIIQALH